MEDNPAPHAHARESAGGTCEGDTEVLAGGQWQIVSNEPHNDALTLPPYEPARKNEPLSPALSPLRGERENAHPELAVTVFQAPDTCEAPIQPQIIGVEVLELGS